MMMSVNIDGVILAAGFSRRTRVFKMALKFGQKALIERTIETMTALCSQVIVVAGYKIQRIIELTRGYPNVEVVFNPGYPAGMFTSVKEGVKHVKSQWFFLTPGDYPLLTKTVYQKLLDARDESLKKHIFIPVFKGRKGHPILVKSELVRELLKEPADSNLRKFIQRKGFVSVEVNDDCILFDIDTMEDYHMAKKRLQKENSKFQIPNSKQDNNGIF